MRFQYKKLDGDLVHLTILIKGLAVGTATITQEELDTILADVHRGRSPVYAIEEIK